jgi:hypothetical protein
MARDQDPIYPHPYRPLSYLYATIFVPILLYGIMTNDPWVVAQTTASMILPIAMFLAPNPTPEQRQRARRHRWLKLYLMALSLPICGILSEALALDATLDAWHPSPRPFLLGAVLLNVLTVAYYGLLPRIRRAS